jgi:hypothetical protein
VTRTVLELGTYGFVAGAVLSAAIGTDLRRWLIVFAAGTAFFVVPLAVLFATAPTEPTSLCHDCSERFGRWIDVRLYGLALMNVAGWWIGTVIGGTGRWVTVRGLSHIRQ